MTNILKKFLTHISLTNQKVLGLSAFICFFLTDMLFLFFIIRSTTLEFKDWIAINIAFIGWIIAFCLVILQIEKNRKDNAELKNKEFKKKLEIDAYRQINDSITEYSSILTTISNSILMFPGQLEFHSESKDKSNIVNYISPFLDGSIVGNIYKGHSILLKSIEANEIAVLEFDYIKSALFLEHHKFIKELKELENFIRANLPQMNIFKRKKDFASKCNLLYERVTDFQSYLYDYRIMLMNHFLGDIFESNVPDRKPLDKNRKILKEIAIKEKVEKEFSALEKSYFLAK